MSRFIQEFPVWTTYWSDKPPETPIDPQKLEACDPYSLAQSFHFTRQDCLSFIVRESPWGVAKIRPIGSIFEDFLLKAPENSEGIVLEEFRKRAKEMFASLQKTKDGLMVPLCGPSGSAIPDERHRGLFETNRRISFLIVLARQRQNNTGT